MKKKLLGILGMIALSSTLTYQSCTDLEEPLYDRIDANKFFKTDAEFQAALTPAYANLRKSIWGYFNVQEVSSDEIVVPTRGGDWGDNGRWVQLYLHTYSPTHSDLNDTWNDEFSGVARCNSVLLALDGAPDSANKAGYIAELRALRAYYYYHLMDLFGNIPVVGKEGVDIANPPATKPRAEVFAFIETELKEVIGSLPPADGKNYGRMTRGAANAILAKLYLNAKTYTGTEKLNECITYCDAVINDGYYKLSDNYLDIFKPNNDTNKEVIFSAVYSTAKDLGWPGMNLNLRTLHYAQPINGAEPWNGFSVPAEFYDKFDKANDTRTKAFLEGQQYKGFDPSSTPLKDRSGNPLAFNKVIGNIFGATEVEGVRCLKYGIDPTLANGSGGNDLVLLRLGDIQMMKAECLLRKGDAAGAVGLINPLRARGGLPAMDAGALNLDEMLKQRGFEVYWEGHRRQDLIRFGKFLEPKTLKSNTSAAHLALFPIPEAQTAANRNLVQNPGY